MKSLLKRIIVSMIKKHLNVVLLIFCIFLLYGLTGASSSHPAKDADTVRSEKIYDGDTIGAVVDGRFEKIRLIGIDAPEMDQRPWGKKARECLRSFISAADSIISLEYDIQRRDKYGRILAYIWQQNKKMINEEMMKKGCAVLFTFPPNVRYTELFRAAQKKAQEDKAGIWDERGLQERPYDYRKKHPRK